MADLPHQLEVAACYDMLLIQAGGNDIKRLHDLDVLRADIEQALRRACELAPRVVPMPCGNVGSAVEVLEEVGEEAGSAFSTPLMSRCQRRRRAARRGQGAVP